MTHALTFVAGLVAGALVVGVLLREAAAHNDDTLIGWRAGSAS